MSKLTMHNTTTTNVAGVPPAPPEAHQRANVSSTRRNQKPYDPLSRKAARALEKYGIGACRRAHYMHYVVGFGASGISLEGPESLKTPSQASAAINAGQELADLELVVWC